MNDERSLSETEDEEAVELIVINKDDELGLEEKHHEKGKGGGSQGSQGTNEQGNKESYRKTSKRKSNKDNVSLFWSYVCCCFPGCVYRYRKSISLLLGILTLLSCLFLLLDKDFLSSQGSTNRHPNDDGTDSLTIEGQYSFPKLLLGNDGEEHSYPYTIQEFTHPNNKYNKLPPYWNDILQKTPSNDAIDPTIQPNWGPCYPTQSSSSINWEEEIQKAQHDIMNGNPIITYPKPPQRSHNGNNNHDLSGYCRPGFIIIGVGKCGTSSLYQYLVGHPRVLPAISKQIHYFKYHNVWDMKWYLSHFPTTESFLSHSAMMTGEASPGYIPYPDVANRLKIEMEKNARDSHDDPQDGHFPTIISIVRNPLERAYSSYKYSYLQPTLKQLKHRHKNESDGFLIGKYIFSFEELIQAEIDTLEDCFQPNGKGEQHAKQIYGNIKPWASEIFKRREEAGLPPLLDLNGACYGNRISKDVPRAQFAKLVKKYPNKIINVQNMMLVQAFVGRSLYSLPLEWWYEIYPKKNLYVVCTEDLKERPASTMSDLSDFLGLPTFNFTDVVNQGMYNTGEHTGYGTATKWESQSAHEDIPLSSNARKRFLSFVKPFNERLFELVGQRCNWE